MGQALTLGIGYALPLARSLPGRLAEVHCTVPRDLARARYRARAAGRHAGHLDADRTDTELWGEPVRPLGVGPVITGRHVRPRRHPRARRPPLSHPARRN